ncbi:hypothetical protein [Candidatus Stoquefichus massiliensis]|uniref:hypothetical protein n=1 Tax=Candidatus Stoquefichus massiliensis TaxID=1470350 RepID=UPI0004B71541|nr:hypothetical protein [Candidatus Stoquefichus massiliensis]
MKLKNKKISKMSILFYVIAALMIIGFGLTFYNVTIYIMGLVASGDVSFAANWMDIFLYYVNNTFLFLGLGTIIFGCGYGIQLYKNMSVKDLTTDQNEEVTTKDVVEETQLEETEEELVEA